jgi:predicted enzyme related to lactoylglutathione lyase
MQFYGGVFGWEFEAPGTMPGDPPGRYFVARVRGRDVAGIGSQPPGGAAPAWNTVVAVQSVSDAVDRAGEAGGTVLDGPIDATPAGRLAVLADPSGAEFCVWEPELRQGAQLVNEPSAWSMSLLHAPEPDLAKHFYRQLFGWEEEEFDAGGSRITLFRLPGYVGGEPHQPVPRDVVAAMAPAAEHAAARWSVDFWIDDADAAVAAARSSGGAVVVAPHDTPGFRSAVLADPQGAAFSVNQLTA